MLTITSNPKVVFQPTESIEWMSKSVAFQKIVQDKLFFSAESMTGRSRIAMADLLGDVPVEPRLVTLKSDLTFWHTSTPNVVKTPEGFMMAFAGRRRRYENRRLFIAMS